MVLTCRKTVHLLLSVSIVTLVVRTITACPAYCMCGGNTVTCNSVPATSLQAMSDDIPRQTSVLEIRGGLFYSIRKADFEHFQAGQLSELRITNGQLRDIQQYAFQAMSYLRRLALNNNQIGTLINGAFSGLSNLNEMDLSNNRLSNLPSSIFESQSNLRSLSIARNKNINNLRGDSFRGLRNLRELLASGCGIRMFESDFFSSVVNLETLDLSFNQISSLPNTGSFKQLRNLRNLTLRGNKLTTLTEAQFPELDLNVLDLSNNLIRSLPANVFMYLRVRNLTLSRNMLQTLPGYVFQPIAAELFSLQLDQNRQLTSLPPDIFYGMTKMQVLNLSNCAIQTLSDTQFKQIFVLREIDLSNNRLKYISQSLLDRSNYLNTIGLSNNLWHCDCSIQPLKMWLQVPYSSNKLNCGPLKINCPKLKCVTPVKLMHRDITMLNDEELGDCENVGESTALSVNILAGIIAGVLLAIAIVVVLIVCCVYQARKRKRGHEEAVPCYDPDEQYNNHKKRQDHDTSHEKKAAKEKKAKEKKSKKKKGKDGYYEEKKPRRNVDPEVGSLNESDKSFVVRNFFHSMNPEPDAESECTHHSMTRKGSQESLSQSGYGYGSRPGSRQSSQYSLNAGYKIESAV